MSTPTLIFGSTSWKATQGTPIDPAQGLARGLVFFAPCWEGSGPNLVDAVTGLELAGTNVAWGHGPSGLGFLATSAGAQGLIANLPASLKPTVATVAVGVRQIGSAGSGSGLIQTSYQSTWASPYAGLRLGVGSGGAITLAYNHAGTYSILTSSGTVANAKDYVLAGQTGAGSQVIYINGEPDATTSSNAGVIQYGTGPTFALGNLNTNGNYNPDALLYWGAMWNRILSPEEHLLLGSGVNWIWRVFKPRAFTGAGSATTSYTLTGPASTTVGVASASFTVTPTTTVTDTLTLSDGGRGGVFRNSGGTPITTLVWTASSAAQTFTYTQATAGSYSLTASSADSYAVAGSPAGIAVNPVGYTLTGPSSGTAGSPVTFTLTPAATATDTITFSDGGHGGAFSPTSLTFSASSTAQTFTYTQSAVGTYSITATSGDGGSITGSPASLTIVASGSMVVSSPAFTFVGTTGTTVTITGTGTSWTAGTPGSPTFIATFGTITAQTINSATSATLTYSAPATNSEIETFTATGATATLPVLIPVTDAHLLFPTGGWNVAGNQAICNYVGNYMKGAFVTPASGSISVHMNMTALGSNAEYVVTVVDSLAPVSTNFEGISSFSAATGLAAGTHYLNLNVAALSTFIDLYTNSPPTGAAIVEGFLCPGGYTAALASPYVYSSTMAFLGDSKISGFDYISWTGTTAGQDASRAFHIPVAAAFSCEAVNIATPGQGLCYHGVGNIPPIYTIGNDTLSSWDKLYTGVSRPWAANLKYFVWPDVGTNDYANGVSSSTYQSTLEAFLPVLRTALGSSVIIFITPSWIGSFASYTAAAISAYLASSGDAKLFYVTTALTTLEAQAFAGSAATYLANDGQHPNDRGTEVMIAKMVQPMQAALGGSFPALGSPYLRGA